MLERPNTLVEAGHAAAHFPGYYKLHVKSGKWGLFSPIASEIVSYLLKQRTCTPQNIVPILNNFYIESEEVEEDSRNDLCDLSTKTSNKTRSGS